MNNAFSLEKRDNGIGILYFDLPGEKVNKFSTPVMLELEEVISRLEQEKLKCLLIISRKQRIFIAGADLKEIFTVTDADRGNELGLFGQGIFTRISKLPFPVIALIDGACMGGGTELALACTYRLATDSPSTKIALPEVNIGLLPGWGGTQRLPRLIGLQNALDVILTGKNLDAKRAYRIGMIDKIIPAEWAEQKALEFAGEIISGKGPGYIKKRNPTGLVSTFLNKSSLGRQLMFKKSQELIMKKTAGHYPAPLRALKVLKETQGLSLEEGLKIEARALGDLIATTVAKNLVQIFFWTDAIKKENGTSKKDIGSRSVTKTAILGAGVMGGGIAQLFAAKGINVRVKDINYEAVSKAYKQASSILKEQLSRRRLTEAEYKEIMHNISGTTDYSGFKHVDLVVEAIIEDLEIKKSVLKELENNISSKTIIASNTSSLLINDMAVSLKDSKRFIGMHFFNPVNRMPLVEIVRGKNTTDETVATIFNLCKKTGKTPIVVNDGPGFLVNRLLVPYLVESISLLEEGHGIKAVDAAMRLFGMPMGPLELFDEIGIDVAWKVANILKQSMSDRMAESDILEKMVKDKRLGKKSGAGFYIYRQNKKVYDPLVEKYIEIKTKTPLNQEQLIKRMVYPMINEAARCFQDNIIAHPRDVDIGMIFGTGFAPFRGGLLNYADSEGLENIINVLANFKNQFGDRFNPADQLVKIQQDQGTFYQ